MGLAALVADVSREFVKFKSREGMMKVYPSPELAGFKHGLRFGKELAIFVSPAVFTLLQTDFGPMSKSLRIHIVPDRRELWRQG